jgi:hypothetical protein
MQHGVMFGCWAHCNATQSAHSAKNCVVVAFCSTAGKHHFTGLTAQSFGHKISGFIKCFSCLTGRSMRTRGVGIHMIEKRGHCLDRLMAHGR